jgi:hypothetical protein
MRVFAGGGRSFMKHAPAVEVTEAEVVRKSYNNCHPLIRQTVGRLAISREWWALNLLRDSPHTPRPLGRPEPWTLLCEYIPGKSLESLSIDKVEPARLIQQGRSLLADLKNAGVVHGDLGHDHWQNMGREANLIWTPESKLVAIDFAGSIPLRPELPVVGPITAALHHHDRLLETKLTHHFCPDWPPEEAEHTRWPTHLWDLLHFLGKL